MEGTEQRATAVSALVLAICAAICLSVGDAVGFRTDADERVFMGTFIAGWFFLFWAVVSGAGAAMSLVLSALSRRPIALSESVTVTAALVLIVIVMALYPAWGSGSGSA